MKTRTKLKWYLWWLYNKKNFNKLETREEIMNKRRLKWDESPNAD